MGFGNLFSAPQTYHTRSRESCLLGYQGYFSDETHSLKFLCLCLQEIIRLTGFSIFTSKHSDWSSALVKNAKSSDLGTTWGWEAPLTLFCLISPNYAK